MSKSRLVVFIYAVLAGIMIGIGGCAYLYMENHVIGAFLFSVGLFSVCTFELNLFTGKVLYLFENDKKYAFNLIIVWIGNFIGAFLLANMIKLTRFFNTPGSTVNLYESAVNLCNTKLRGNLLSLFILAILCNILIYIAVDGYKSNKTEIGKYLGLIFGVMGFILCGFEHSIADMFYFSVAGIWNVNTFISILVITLGNSIGGLIFPVCKIIKEKSERKIS